jgi:hypothetical protein
MSSFQNPCFFVVDWCIYGPKKKDITAKWQKFTKENRIIK